MVPTENEEILGILDLVCQKQAYRFERLLASVDVVAEKEIIGFWRETSILKKAEQIVVLAVYITTDL